MSLNEIWIVASGQTELGLSARSLAPVVKAVASQAVPGADLTLVWPTPEAGGLIEDYAQSIADTLKSQGAQLVLFEADVQSRLLAGLVAAYLGTAPRNAASIDVSDGVVITRLAYGGLAATTERLVSTPAVLVAGPGVLPAVGDSAATGATEELPITAAASGCKLIEVRPKSGESVNLTAAKQVVGVGRGFNAPEDLELARELAAKLGAEVACSRPIAEGVGWLPADRYIGVSGATIKPDLYLAIGISGQIQHLVGVNKAKTIVAINKDKQAPIFKQADFGIVGDLYQVLPALIAALG